MGNWISRRKIEGLAGVAFFGKSSSVVHDLQALEWAIKHLPLSNEYKLLIIHVNELDTTDPPRQLDDSRYDYKGLESELKKYPDYNADEINELQTGLENHGVKEHICGVTYEGENFKKALECAIESEHLDVLVLAWWEEADGTKGPPIDRLESETCSIILHKVPSSSRRLSLTFSMPPTAPTAGPSTDEPTSSGS